MKVTFLTRSLNRGGAERQLVNLATGLHKRGFRVLVAVFYSNGPLEKELREAGVPVSVIGKQGRWDVFGFLLRLVRLLRRERPSILHGYLAGPNLTSILLKPIFRRIRVVWGVRHTRLDFRHLDRLSNLSLWVEGRLAHFIDLAITNSYAGKAYAVGRGFPEDKVVVIPNGIDTKRFYPDSEARGKIRAEWGVKDYEKLVGLVGRLIHFKDHPTFLKASALLSKERKDVRFVCVGGGPVHYARELRTLAEDLGLADNLIWVGARADTHSVYNALDVAASSSYGGEGFPNVVGEAMACGVKCVVTDVGDSARIVRETGIVVPPKDPNALARALQEAIAHEDTASGRRSRRERIEAFSLKAMIDKTADVLDRV